LSEAEPNWLYEGYGRGGGEGLLLSRIQFVSVNDSLVDVAFTFFIPALVRLPIFIGIFSTEPKIPQLIWKQQVTSQLMRWTGIDTHEGMGFEIGIGMGMGMDDKMAQHDFCYCMRRAPKTGHEC